MNNTTDKPTVTETSETNPVNQLQPGPEVAEPKEENAAVWQTEYQSWCRLLAMSKKVGWHPENDFVCSHWQEYTLSTGDAKSLAAALEGILRTLSDVEMPETPYEEKYEWINAQFWQGRKQKAHLAQLISLANAGALDVSVNLLCGPSASATVRNESPQESSLSEALLEALEADLDLRKAPDSAAVIRKADGLFRYGSAKALLHGETIHRIYNTERDRSPKDWAWYVYYESDTTDPVKYRVRELLGSEEARRSTARCWAKASLRPAMLITGYPCEIGDGDSLVGVGYISLLDWVAIIRKPHRSNNEPTCICFVYIDESEAMRLRDERYRRSLIGQTLPELTAEEKAAVKLLGVELTP